MTNKDKNIISSLALLTLGLKYLNLASIVLKENIRQGNVHQVLSDGPFMESEYTKKTQWSDFNIFEPVLFNFYHGLELTMKGLLFLLDTSSVKTTHGLRDLFASIEPREQIADNIKKILARHIDVSNRNGLIAIFLRKNSLNIDQIYEALRYPSDKNFQRINDYFNLHYQENRSLPYFRSLISDINILSRETVTLYREVGGA